MFTIGHSVTLMTGVLANIQVNAYLIDAIIGLSVVYKGFDNLGGFKHFFGKQPDPKKAVLIFGLFHGFGFSDQNPRVSIAKRRFSYEFAVFQYWRRNRSVFSVNVYFVSHQLLASIRQF